MKDKSKFKTDNTIIKVETAVLVALISKDQSDEQTTEYLDELEFLTLTAGGVAVKRFVQRLESPNPKTFIGTGKLAEG